MRTAILRTGRVRLMATAASVVVACQTLLLAHRFGEFGSSAYSYCEVEIIEGIGPTVELPERLPDCFGKPAAPSFPIPELPIIDIEETQATDPPVLFLAVRPDDTQGGGSTTAVAPVSPISLEPRPDSYMKVRRSLEAGVLPPDVMVRIDDFLNRAGFVYASPKNARLPFAVHAEATVTPWRGTYLLKIGLKTYEPGERPPVNLLVIDAGTVPAQQPGNGGLVRGIISALGSNQRPGDRVGLLSTTGPRRVTLENAYDHLKAMATVDALNSLVVLTSGNVGFHDVDDAALADYVADRRKQALYLSVITVGIWPKARSERLAEAGGGIHHVVDGEADARSLSVGGLVKATPVAHDVTAEVHFNAAVVQSYRPPLYLSLIHI